MGADIGELVAELRAAVGSANIFTDDDAAAYGRDERGILTGPILAAVRPGSTDEVAAVVRNCAAHRVPIVTQGGNTGLCGGAHPVDQQTSVLVSLSRMRTIESVDPDDSTATVQAGATIESIQDAAAGSGLMFAPDWGASGTATIGGAVSTNAGGINVLQFGPMRDHILGLEVVLADGRVWDGLRSLRKDSSGYQIRHLFIGAEGTLGIITRAVVRLLPALADQQTAIVALPRLEAVLPLLTTARRDGATITAFELMPEVGVAAVLEKFGLRRPIDTIAAWYVLVRVATPKGIPASTAMSNFLEQAAAAQLIMDAGIGGTREQEANLWTIRDELRPTQLFTQIDGYIKYDAAVPVGRVVEFIDGVESITADLASRWRPYSFGHVGDGNIHLYLLPPAEPNPQDHPSPGQESDERSALKAAVDTFTVELGGTLSAEHGIGQLLRQEMLQQKSDLELELSWRIKDALDPDDLFNPGKTLPPRPPR